MRNKKAIIGCLSLFISAHVTASDDMQASTKAIEAKKTQYLLHKETNVTTGLVKTFNYDEKGNLLSEVHTEGGVQTQAYVFSYDENNHMTSISMLSNEYGAETLTPVETINYDNNGNAVSRNIDVDGSGLLNTAEAVRYDSNNNLLSYLKQEDGTKEQGEYTYNEQSKPLSFEKVITNDKDEVIGRVKRIKTYNEQGKELSSIEIKTDQDDVVINKVIEEKRYNDQGQLVYSMKEVYADGKSTKDAYEVTYSGNMMTELMDKGADGYIDQMVNYVYNDDWTNVVAYALDRDMDGLPDKTAKTVYDSNNNVASITRDDNGDGMADYMEINTYDHQNNLLSKKVDRDGDGEYDRISYATYDENNDVIANVITHYNGEGGYKESQWNYEYDENSNKMSLVFMNDHDGVVREEKTIFEYLSR